MEKVYIVVSLYHDDGLREYDVEGVYRSRERAKKKLREIVDESVSFAEATNPDVEEDYACTSKDWSDDKWLELYIIEREVER